MTDRKVTEKPLVGIDPLTISLIFSLLSFLFQIARGVMKQKVVHMPELKDYVQDFIEAANGGIQKKDYSIKILPGTQITINPKGDRVELECNPPIQVGATVLGLFVVDVGLFGSDVQRDKIQVEVKGARDVLITM